MDIKRATWKKRGETRHVETHVTKNSFANSKPKTNNQWLLVPLKGGIGSIFHPPEGKEYKWYISGIYCQLGDYMPPTTF